MGGRQRVPQGSPEHAERAGPEGEIQDLGPSPDPGRGSQRSRSPSAAGPEAARPPPEAKPTKDPDTGALCYKLSDTSSKSSASSEKWGDFASSVGGADDRLEALEVLKKNLDAKPLPDPQPAPAPPSRGPSSVASAESGWEIVQDGKDKKRKGPASSVLSSSKSSRMSEALSRASGFLKKPPPSC